MRIRTFYAPLGNAAVWLFFLFLFWPIAFKHLFECFKWRHEGSWRGRRTGRGKEVVVVVVVVRCKNFFTLLKFFVMCLFPFFFFINFWIWLCLFFFHQIFFYIKKLFFLIICLWKTSWRFFAKKSQMSISISSRFFLYYFALYNPNIYNYLSLVRFFMMGNFKRNMNWSNEKLFFFKDKINSWQSKPGLP